MGQWGVFHFDAQLISISERKVIDGKNETITTPRLASVFLTSARRWSGNYSGLFSLSSEARKSGQCARLIYRVQCLLKFVDIARACGAGFRAT